MVVSFTGGVNRSTQRKPNHRPAESHEHNLSIKYIVHLTMSGIWTHNSSSDRW